MHAFRRYLQDGLDARGWSQAEFAQRSGLTRQRVSQMLNDDRDRLPAVPKRDTLQAISRAFSVGESTVTAVAFEAMGYDLAAVRREADLSTASTQDIVRALANRVGVRLAAEESGSGGDAAPTTNVSNLPATTPKRQKPRTLTATEPYQPRPAQQTDEELHPDDLEQLAAYTPGSKTHRERIDESMRSAGEEDQDRG